MISEHKPSPPLKIALLVSDRYANQYIRDLLITLKNDSLVELADLIVVKNPAKKSFVQILCFFLFRIILETERLFLFRSRRVVNHMISRHEISSLFRRVTEIASFDLKAGNLKDLVGLDLDIVITLGDEIEGVYTLSPLAKIGLLSANFTPAGTSQNYLAGFWEVFYKFDCTPFKINRIHADGKEEGLLQCLFQTRYCFLLNKSFLFKKSGIHFYNFILEVAQTRMLKPSANPLETLSKSKALYRMSLSVVFSYVLKTWKIVLKKIYRTLRFNGFRWHVVIYNRPLRNSLSSEPRIIPNPPERFLADPFLIEHDSKTYCFVEDFDYRTKKGNISCLEIQEKSFSDIKVCLEETFHLSFPYVFKYKEHFYMCPETCDRDQIRIYKAVNFPYEWKLEKVIMDNVRAADTLLFEKHGRWWMLTNIDPSRIGDNSSELYLFSSDSPLSTDWIRHSINPIYVNAMKARNGGIIIEKDAIYRIAQKQTFDTYGAAVAIYRIDEISPTTYVENFVNSIEANYLPNILGTHHISGTDQYTALDFYDLGKY